MIEDKRIIDMTAKEFADFLKETLQNSGKGVIEKEGIQSPISSKRYVYGISGLGALLGCSQTTACRVKSSGILDEAITQVGRKIIVDADLAISLFNAKNTKKQ